jgi:hypothetical protein
MTPLSVEHAKRQLIEVLQAEAAHLSEVAAALEEAKAPAAVLSALEPLGKTHLCARMNALSGTLGVLALLAQEREQVQRQAQA